MTSRRPCLHRGFTLVELLTVIGIIILLLAILLPVVSQVRVRANIANTQQQMSRIMSACVNYYHDFNSYPGPLPENQLQGTGQTVIANIKDPSGQVKPKNITSSENLVLGLLYYLKPPANVGGPVTYVPDDPIGSMTVTKTTHDPANLNPLHPESYHFIDYLPEELSPGLSGLMGNVDGTTPPKSMTATDSAVPEFIDKIPESMPILYMRAKAGATLIVSNRPATGNQPQAQYDRSQLAAYGFMQVKKQTDDPDNGFPTTLPNGMPPQNDTPEWINYMMNPNILGQAKGKDGFVLISAGPDRKYGTKDDIIVAP